MALEVGSTIPFQFTVRDAAGALVNAVAIAVTVTAPDGTTTTPATGNPSTGIYTADVTASMHGTWSATAATTTPTDVSPAQSFYVEALAATVTPVSLADAKAHLRQTNTSQDDQIRVMLIAATRIVEQWTGRTWVRETATETYDGGRTAIPLRRSPVRTVNTVTESGTTLTVTDWFLRGDAPILVRGTTTGPGTWAYGQQNVSVTYVAGPQEVPAPVREAIKRVLAALWTSQRGGGEMPDGVDLGLPTSFVTSEVRALLEPFRRAGIA